MRIILSILAVLAFFGAVLVLPVRLRKKIQRLIDQIISESVFRQLLFLAIVTVLAFGFLVLFMLLMNGGMKLNLSDWILAFINPGTSFANGERMEGVERTWALITGVIGIVFMSGLLISVISNIMERRIENVKNGKVYYYFKNHVVIIGNNRMGIGLISQFARDMRYRHSEIVLLTTQEAPKVRHELFSRLKPEIEKRVTIVSGNRTTIEDLEHLHIDLCKEIFILGENDEYDNDSLNLECVRKIHTISVKKSVKSPIRCNVRLEHQSTFAVFQRLDIDRLKDLIDFVPFNYYEMWAQKVFVEGAYESLMKDGLTGKLEYTPLDREGIDAESDKRVHLVVAGMSEIGVVMGLQAARLCHFPNFVTKGVKTRITFIDKEADQKMIVLRGRYRHLFDETEVYYREVNRNDMLMKGSLSENEVTRINTRVAKELFTDIEFEFIKANLEYPAIQDYLAGLSCDDSIYLTVAICFSSPPQALSAGLYLPDELYDNHIPILVQQEIPYCTLDMLTKEGRYKFVKPFGMLENCYDLSKADDRIPMMVNYVYSKGIPEVFPPKEIETMWRGLPTALQWSNRYHADSIKFKLRSFRDFDFNEPLKEQQIDLMARVEHNRWNMEKLLMGYRPTSPLEKETITNDLSKKNELKINLFAHHDICPYDDLQPDMTGVNAIEYDRRISEALPLIVRKE